MKYKVTLSPGSSWHYNPEDFSEQPTEIEVHLVERAKGPLKGTGLDKAAQVRQDGPRTTTVVTPPVDFSVRLEK